MSHTQCALENDDARCSEKGTFNFDVLNPRSLYQSDSAFNADSNAHIIEYVYIGFWQVFSRTTAGRVAASIVAIQHAFVDVYDRDSDAIP